MRPVVATEASLASARGTNDGQYDNPCEPHNCMETEPSRSTKWQYPAVTILANRGRLHTVYCICNERSRLGKGGRSTKEALQVVTPPTSLTTSHSFPQPAQRLTRPWWGPPTLIGSRSTSNETPCYPRILPDHYSRASRCSNNHLMGSETKLRYGGKRRFVRSVVAFLIPFIYLSYAE